MPANAYEYFVGRENRRLVRMLERNHDLAAMVQGLLEFLVEYCDRTGRSVDDVTIDRPSVTIDGFVQFRIR